MSAPRVFVSKPVQGRLRLRLPYADSNRHWLSESLGCRPEWDGYTWQVARTHFGIMLPLLWKRFEQPITVTVEGHESKRCGDSCRYARGVDCVCSCAGARHGEVRGASGWRQVGETTVIRSVGTVMRRYVWTPPRGSRS